MLLFTVVNALSIFMWITVQNLVYLITNGPQISGNIDRLSQGGHTKGVL